MYICFFTVNVVMFFCVTIILKGIIMSWDLPVVKELESRNIAYVSYVGNYMGNTGIFKELIGKLFAWAAPKGLCSNGASLFSAYQDDPCVTPPEELKLEVCLEVPEGTQPSDGVEIKVAPGGKYSVLHAEVKTPEEYGPAWESIVSWMVENNLEIDMSRPSYEFYLNNLEEHPHGHHIIDICMSTK